MQPQPEPQPVGRVTKAEEALPLAADAADAQPFTYADAVAQLKGSCASHLVGYISVAAAIATLTLNLHILRHGEEDGSEVREARIFGVACAATFATGQVIPLAKATRDRFVASLHDMDGAPKGLKALRGTTESYITAAVFFIASIIFCGYAIAGLAETMDQVMSLTLSLFFLISSSAWVCKSTRDRVDVTNELWEEDERLTPVILRLARGTGTNVLLCLTAWLSSFVLTLVCIWKSDNEESDKTMKLLLTMGALFQTIAALWLAKVVFASGRRVTATDWLLAVVGGLAALGITWGAVISEWEKMGDSALGVLTGLAFNLFSTFFFTKLVRDHKELEKRGWDVSLCKTLCCGSEMQRSS